MDLTVSFEEYPSILRDWNGERKKIISNDPDNSRKDSFQLISTNFYLVTIFVNECQWNVAKVIAVSPSPFRSEKVARGTIPFAGTSDNKGASYILLRTSVIQIFVLVKIPRVTSRLMWSFFGASKSGWEKMKDKIIHITTSGGHLELVDISHSITSYERFFNHFWTNLKMDEWLLHTSQERKDTRLS